MASRRQKKKKAKQALALTKEQIKEFNKVMMESQKFNVNLGLPIDLPKSLSSKPTFEELKIIRERLGSGLQLNNLLATFSKEIKQERLARTRLGDYTNMQKNQVIRLLIDKGIIKSKSYAYEDYLIDNAYNFTEEELSDFIRDYKDKMEMQSEQYIRLQEELRTGKIIGSMVEF